MEKQLRPTDEVLECACGHGLLTGVIAPRCKKLVATDFSAKMLQRTKRKCAKYGNIRFEQANILQLPYPNARFDAVVAANVLHLLDEPYRALQELDRVCRPGGRLIIPTYINQTDRGTTNRVSGAIGGPARISSGNSRWIPTGHSSPRRGIRMRTIRCAGGGFPVRWPSSERTTRMKVTTLDEEAIRAIGHAFGYYDYGTEHGLIDAFPSREAAAAFIRGYVRMARGKAGCSIPQAKTAKAISPTSSPPEAPAAGGASPGQGAARLHGTKRASPLCPDHVQGRRRAG